MADEKSVSHGSGARQGIEPTTGGVGGANPISHIVHPRTTRVYRAGAVIDFGASGRVVRLFFTPRGRRRIMVGILPDCDASSSPRDQLPLDAAESASPTLRLQLPRSRGRLGGIRGGGSGHARRSGGGSVALLMPILDVWKSAPPSDFTGDASGAWGPEAAESLLAQDGRAWLQPTSLNMTQRPPPASDVC